MSNVSTEGSAPTKQNEAQATTPVESPTSAAVATHTNGPSRSRRAITLIEQHPLKVIAVGVAAGALIEVEFALGLLAGIGATVLFATRTGSEARRDLLDTGKRIFGRARGAFAGHAESAPSAPSDAA